MNITELLRTRWKTLTLMGAGALLVGLQWGRIRAAVQRVEAVPTAQASERPASHGILAEGRIVTYPGAEVIVGTDRGGTIVRLLVAEKQSVTKGELIAEIDSSEERAALTEAYARAAEADVDAKFFDVELGRSQRLLASGSIPKDALDRSNHDLDAARARKHEAVATGNRLAAVVAKSRIVAPIDGTVLERYVDQGETVAPGARLVTVADLARTRIEVEVDEFDAGRVVVGQPVVVRAEGFGDASWKAHVEEIPDSVTSRRLKPEDPGRPSDTRVLLVKVALDEPAPLKLGQRVEADIAAAR